MFLTLRDGTGLLQCVLTNDLCQIYNALVLTTESSVQLFGTLNIVADEKDAPGGHVLNVDYWELISLAHPDGSDIIQNKNADLEVQLNNRHIIIRDDKTAKILRMRSAILHAFRAHYHDKGYTEITPPIIVQTQVDCGAAETLIGVDYYG